MKAFNLLFAASLFAVHSGQVLAADPVDPQYEDETIQRIESVFKMTGAIQLDRRAVRQGANEWTIDVDSIDLAGNTVEAVEASWQKFLGEQKKQIVKDLRDQYSELIASDIESMSPEAARRISRDADITVSVQEGEDQEQTRKWIVRELLTGAGRANCESYFLKDTRKKLDFYRYHQDDHNAEVIGYDTLLIRGVRKVLRVKIFYVHA